MRCDNTVRPIIKLFAEKYTHLCAHRHTHNCINNCSYNNFPLQGRNHIFHSLFSEMSSLVGKQINMNFETDQNTDLWPIICCATFQKYGEYSSPTKHGLSSKETVWLFSWSSSDDGAEVIKAEAVLLKSQAQTMKSSERKDLRLCKFWSKPEGADGTTVRMLFWQLLLLNCVATFYTSMISVVSPKRERNALVGSFVNY